MISESRLVDRKVISYTSGAVSGYGKQVLRQPVGVAVSVYPFHDGVALFLPRWVAYFRRECVLWKDDRINQSGVQ